MNYEILKDGKWSLYDWKKKYEDVYYEDGEKKYNWKKVLKDPLYINRNYDLFSILANVRNGYGFAGCPTGSGFIPISQPRGLPEDVTEEVERSSQMCGIDGHSHTWLMLNEILNYDWHNKKTIKYGVVNCNQYTEFLKNGKPSSWCNEVSGKTVSIIEPEDMDKIITSTKRKNPEIKYYTRVQWKSTYRDTIGNSWFNTLKELKKLGKPDKIRLVFWFDN